MSEDWNEQMKDDELLSLLAFFSKEDEMKREKKESDMPSDDLYLTPGSVPGEHVSGRNKNESAYQQAEEEFVEEVKRATSGNTGDNRFLHIQNQIDELREMILRGSQINKVDFSPMTENEMKADTVEQASGWQQLMAENEAYKKQLEEWEEKYEQENREKIELRKELEDVRQKSEIKTKLLNEQFSLLKNTRRIIETNQVLKNEMNKLKKNQIKVEDVEAENEILRSKSSFIKDFEKEVADLKRELSDSRNAYEDEIIRLRASFNDRLQTERKEYQESLQFIREGKIQAFPAEKKAGVHWLWILSLLANLILIFLLIFFLMQKKNVLQSGNSPSVNENVYHSTVDTLPEEVSSPENGPSGINDEVFDAVPNTSSDTDGSRPATESPENVPDPEGEKNTESVKNDGQIPSAENKAKPDVTFGR